MVEIIPAIIPKTFADLQEKMSLVSELVPMVQIDVMDGIFVPEKAWPYARAIDQDFADILKEIKGFPFWEELDYEVDLMVSNPERVWEDWLIAGAKRVILHAESTTDPLALIMEMKKKLPRSDSFLYTEVGLALNIDTPNEKIESLIPEIDFVQFMGIEKIGFQGQPFDERVLQKIRDLRGKFPNVTISVDGGVNKKSAPELVKAGANRLVAGSAIFESGDIAVALEEFQELIEGYTENGTTEDN